MNRKLNLHQDRLFPADATQRAIARQLYEEVRRLPIVSPHGHTDPQWFADNKPFPDPATLLVIPDHYVYRMLYSQGVSLESLGVPRTDGGPVEQDSRKIWRLFAQHWYLFRGTPTQMWFQHVLHEVFGIRERLTPESAESIYDAIADCLSRPEFLPRSLYERFNIEVLSTTESPTRFAAASSETARVRMERTCRSDLSPRPGGRSGIRRLCEQCSETRRNDGRRHDYLVRISAGPIESPPVFRRAGRDGNRSRPLLRNYL